MRETKASKKNLIGSLAEGGAARPALQRRIAEMALGVVSALRRGELAVEQVWDELFNLDNYSELRRRRLDKSLREMFEYGMELENVAEISPGSLEESLRSIETLAGRVMSQSRAKRRVKQKV